ncbi:hypothetical protein [Bradyrhizobium erythrophlei]|nr:hypothetical protein [Bradyrhizobium erythrophlei]
MGSSFDHLVSAGKQRRRNFKAEQKIATPVNWKHGEDAIIAGSATDEDVPSSETFVPPTLRRQNTSGLPEEGRLCFAIIDQSRSITTGRRSWSLSGSWSRSFLMITVSSRSRRSRSRKCSRSRSRSP